jgi:hypothetical protein
MCYSQTYLATREGVNDGEYSGFIYGMHAKSIEVTPFAAYLKEEYIYSIIVMSKSGRIQTPSRPGPIDESDPAPKPLAATLLQEFQNLKDKFKNEDDGTERGSSFILLIFYNSFLPFTIN